MQKKILIIFYLLIYQSVSFAEDNYWEKLLHLKNNKTHIISENFYISELNDLTAEKELLLSINYINSTKGKNFVCNFPARYLYIRKNYPVKNYSLEDCNNLNKFLLDYKKDKISIAFASEYTNNPSSVFGHTMLVLHNNNKDLEVGDVVHFFAHTEEDDKFLKYIVSGLSGEYDSYYGSDKFFKKLYKYNTLQQRYIYVYTLNFTKKDIKIFLYHLYELRKAKFKYYFGTINCAQKISDLLSIVKTPKQKKYNFFSLPIDVIKSYENYVVDKYTYLPLLYELKILTKDFTKKEKVIFNQIIDGAKFKNIKMSNKFKLALINKTIFDFRFFRKVNQNYNKIMELDYDDILFNDKTLNPTEKIYPKNVTFGIKDNSLVLNYNIVGKYINDLSSDFIIQDTEVKALNIAITSDDNLKIENFDFISIKSFPTINFYYKPSSWVLYSGFNRNNYNKQLRFNNEIGKGKTFYKFNIFKSTFLLSAGNEDNKIYLKPKIILSMQHKNTKYGIDYYKKYSKGTKDYISYEYYFGLLIEDKYLLTKFSDNELSMNLRFSF